MSSQSRSQCVRMPIIRSQLQPECVERLIRQEVESSFLQDVVFLCEDGTVGFTRCLLSTSPLLLELLPPPGSSCCEKLLRLGEAKVHLSLDGVKAMDLQKVLGFLTGVKQQMSSESREVAAMLGFPLPSPLLDLPGEIWLKVLRPLTSRELCQAGLVCRQLLHLTRDPSLWTEVRLVGDAGTDTVSTLFRQVTR